MAANILPAPKDNLALAHDANQHVRGLIKIPAVRQFHLKPLKESLARKLGSDQGLPKASRTVAAQCVPHYLLKKVAQKMQMQGLFKVFGTGLDPELGFRNVDVLKHHGRLQSGVAPIKGNLNGKGPSHRVKEALLNDVPVLYSCTRQ